VQIIPVGDRALLVDLDSLERVHAVWRNLRSNPPAGTEEVVAGACSVLVTFQAGTDLGAAAKSIGSTSSSLAVSVTPNRVEIPVAYGGPDTDEVASLSGISRSAIGERHSEREYTVAFLGFSPGFAYLVGGDPALRVPRLSTPRRTVPAGSVALASEFTAVYPQSTPGGWRIVGRTDVSMFDPSRSQPSLLAPGDLVRFKPVKEVGPFPGWRLDHTRSVSSDYLTVLEPGPLTTVQDGGRIGWSHLGVPRGGAADRQSAAFANQLVGNDPAAAVLEATLSGPLLRLGSDRVVAITGARATVTVDGIPARPDTALPLPAGSELGVGTFRSGARAYLAFAGGVDVGSVLGSRSTDTLSQLGPPPLRAGDVLALGTPVGPSVGLPVVPASGPGDAVFRSLPASGDLIRVRAVRGPRYDWIGPTGMETLSESVFEVDATSDRTGIRLKGPLVEIDRREELPSEGVVAGAVQVPASGSPIILMRNHPTTGGYPVAAVVDGEGVDLLAQACPGVRVKFELG
jgi:KipI family sensor histidine kinase inhibitor